MAQLESMDLPEPVSSSHKADNPPAKSRWWIWLLVLGVIAIGFWYYRGSHSNAEAENTNARGNAAAGGAGGGKGRGGAGRRLSSCSRGRRHRATRRSACLLHRTRHRHSFQHRHRPHPRRWPVGQRGFQRRPVRAPRRCARADRPATRFKSFSSRPKAQLAKDQAQRKDAEVNLERFKLLYGEGVIPKQQMDTQQSQVGQFDGAIKTDQATIDSAKLQLSYSRITAPISGRIGLRLVDAGNMVHASDPGGLLVITQLQPISVIFSLPQDQLPQVVTKTRSGTQLPVEAFDRDNTAKIASGSLASIDNQIDTTTGTYKLKAMFQERRQRSLPQPIRQCALARRHQAQSDHRSHRRHPARPARHLRLRRGQHQRRKNSQRHRRADHQ